VSRHSSNPPRRPATRAEPGVPARLALVSEQLKARGLKHSAVRDVVIEEFFKAGTHVSIEQLLDRVRAREPATGYSTVYRTLRVLVEAGHATERDFGGAHTLFEPADAPHHDHVVCLKCGEVREFEEPVIEELQERVARRLGFRITSHRMELYGLCAACAAEGPGGSRGRGRTS
jgi:Fur family ferric uptake transcriptional regulator